MDDEVSVAQLLEREGWDEHAPPRPGSRLRVLAVMGAVVLGCGVAAVLVRPAPDGESQALWPEETNVIGIPGTPTGGGLPGAVTMTATAADTTATEDGPRSTESESAAAGDANGTDDTDGTDGADGVDETSDPATPSGTASSTGAGQTSATSTGGSSSARDDRPDPPDPPDEPPVTSSSTRPPPTTTTRPRDDCWWLIFC